MTYSQTWLPGMAGIAYSCWIPAVTRNGQPSAKVCTRVGRAVKRNKIFADSSLNPQDWERSSATSRQFFLFGSTKIMTRQGKTQFQVTSNSPVLGIFIKFIFLVNLDIITIKIIFQLQVDGITVCYLVYGFSCP